MSGSSRARSARTALSPSPLVRGAAASALVLALGGIDDPEPPPPAVVPPAAAARGAAGAAALCGPRTVPEGAACVPLPALGAPLPEGGAAALSDPAGARPAGARPAAASTRSQNHEHIPRRPERPASAAAYTFPIGAPDEPPAFLLVEDAPAGASAQPPAGSIAAIGAARPEPPSWLGGVEIAATRGERVAALRLEGQEGKAEVVFVGALSGITVATAHDVREADRVRRYVVLHGHLDRPGPGVVAGARLDAGDVVGYAGETGSLGLVRLHLEARQLREGARISELDAKRITDAAVTVPCDLRNVLPLRQGASL
ncbi:M23 family metallopeptidase [Sorangium sp. So ce1000]|uniref:M23 family metallopeptidase n=1 Tax=Sorangium sp. So ce1000 TaxID=3133325 RepID=UPI003F62910C